MSNALIDVFKNPTTLDEQVESITQATYISAISRIKLIMANKDGYGPDQILLILEQAQAREVRATTQRPAVRQALRNAIKKLTMSSNPKPTSVEVTTEQPKDPRWDHARQISENLRLCGRMFLRGQVKLGMVLSALKREVCQHGGSRLKQVPESGTCSTWADLVKQETGYSRQSCDEFIRLYEATKAKLKASKKLDLPAPAKKDAIVLFQTENPLALTDEQWTQVDLVIGTLTTGETQASLMQELGIVPKPKMPTGTKKPGGTDDEPTAGQLAFHFFDAMAAPLINARTNPDYKTLLYALPIESTEDQPLSLSTLEAELRAALADIEEVKQSTAKQAKGRIVNV